MHGFKVRVFTVHHVHVHVSVRVGLCAGFVLRYGQAS